MEEDYRIGTLGKWQSQANAVLLGVVAQSMPSRLINFEEACKRGLKFYETASKLNPHYPWFPKNLYSDLDIGVEIPFITVRGMKELLNGCMSLTPTNPWSSLYTHTVALQMRVLAAYQKVLNEVCDINRDQEWPYHWIQDHEIKAYRLSVESYSAVERSKQAKERILT